ARVRNVRADRTGYRDVLVRHTFDSPVQNLQVLRYYSALKYMYYQSIATSTHISRISLVVTVHSRSRHPVGVAVTSSRGLRYFESGPSTVPDVNSSPTVPSSAESSVLSFTDKQEC